MFHLRQKIFCLVTLLVTLQDQSSLRLVKILTGVCMLNNVCSILNRPFHDTCDFCTR